MLYSCLILPDRTIRVSVKYRIVLYQLTIIKDFDNFKILFFFDHFVCSGNLDKRQKKTSERNELEAMES